MKVALVTVTEDNHQWVSEMTGVGEDEITRRYQRSLEDGIPCTIAIHPDAC
jgi:hypothetical protein